MQAFPLRTITETDMDGVVDAAGGRRAHSDADRREDIGADYIIGQTVIELKLLDEEGFDKPERQAKLAELFRPSQLDRPVVVLDAGLLPQDQQRRYRNIVEQPVKGAIAKARKQLAQTRREFPETTGSVFWIFNNGYTALDHDMLEELVANRIRQDTSSIDGVIVSGCYYHSDGFDGIVLWPCRYIPIHFDQALPEVDTLQSHFHAFAERFMTDVVLRTTTIGEKFEVRDLTFACDGVRYVKPAPILGSSSDFYVRGRPRSHSEAPDGIPPVALIVPGLNKADHALIASVVRAASGPLSGWDAWQRHLDRARGAATSIKPVTSILVDGESWLRWCQSEETIPSLQTLNRYAHDLFTKKMLGILDAARDHASSGIMPSSYLLAITQEIGQDQANDVSDIAVVRERLVGDPMIRPIVENVRISHDHALALAAAYSLTENVDVVRWKRDRRHSWL